MVNWYKHDIPAWMDSTESLPDGAYRVHHIVCQLIYLNEGPIRLHEQGIAGRCNQHILAFRKNLNLLLTLGQLTLNPDQTLSQPRAYLELERIGRNRVNAGLGGRKNSKSLKTNDMVEATLKDTSSHKTREEKTREDTAPPNGGSSKEYAFEDGIIRLNQTHFDQWSKAYSNLDLAAELLSLSKWAEGEGKNWFHAVKGALAKRNREIKTKKDALADQGGFKWNGNIEGVI